MSWVSELARPEIVALKPYEHAAWEPASSGCTPTSCRGAPMSDDTDGRLNRYPEPQPHELVQRLAALYGVRPAQLLVGRGSDEAIDLLVRALLPRRAGFGARLPADLRHVLGRGADPGRGRRRACRCARNAASRSTKTQLLDALHGRT